MTAQNETEANSSFAGLSNEEICVLYYIVSSKLAKVNKGLDKGRVYEKQNLDEDGLIQHIIEVPVDAKKIQEIKDLDFYRLVSSAVAKLGPYVELVQDITPSVISIKNDLENDVLSKSE